MRELPLRRHGENFNPIYAAVEGEVSWAGRSTDLERPDGQVSGIVKRFKKGNEAAPDVSAIGLVKSKFADAIEYTGIAIHVRGQLLFFGVVGGFGGIGFGLLYLNSLVTYGVETTFDQFFIFLSLGLIFWGMYFLFGAIRQELFSPVDLPIIFDRKRRKVYRLYREYHPGLFGLFKRWPIHAVEYDWDLIDVEHNALLTRNGSNTVRYHSLVFIIRRSATDPTIIDNFQIGTGMQLGELSVAPVWEHIRRFMECDGPHLPRGEGLNTEKPPRTLWESWAQIGLVGPNYTRMWKDWWFVMLVLHLLSPVLVPIFSILGIFNWLSYLTSTPVAWPKEVVDTVGPRETMSVTKPTAS